MFLSEGAGLELVGTEKEKRTVSKLELAKKGTCSNATPARC
ncbi:hypothetical protein [uncultured Gammaproteobacteria bacterium]|nr:hypothetical protein [uncultured Gammaproteobacteria bacterium]CAC9513667.1 hypothetical protein [uncultured Gammaproteobacteria bacterium]CAC9524545.1 hypothetical protein [uncultured Gammaproteobacteria bacterium]CAC9535016.1 hypothetical protein [uncultured Gammaproteobacteria bacterium]CAC9547835.1 hypothetical protein [uncultured Gammaproteobacteria bacterium]